MAESSDSVRTKKLEDTIATIELWERWIKECERSPAAEWWACAYTRSTIIRTKLLDHNYATFSGP